jgi:tetratricopeptide (TPR) repeat protein
LKLQAKKSTFEGRGISMKRKTHKTLMILFVALLLIPTTFVYADYKLGIQYFKQGKYVEAAGEFQAEVDMAPNYDYGYYMLGMCYFKLKKYDQSIDNFNKAIELSQEKFDYHYGLAQVYLKKKQYYKVTEILNSAANLAGTPSQKYGLHYLRGIGYSGQKKHADAVEDLKKAKAIKANQALLKQLGKSCFQIGDCDGAIEAFKASLKISPDSYDAVFYLASSYIEKAQREKHRSKKKPLYAEAVKYAAQAVQMKPDEIESLNLLGRANLGARNFDVAIKNFKEVIKKRSSYCWAMVNIAKSYIAQEKWLDAENWLDKAANCDVRSVVALETLGFVLMKQKKLEQSLETYQKAQSMQPSASIKDSISIVKNKIEIRDHNIELEKKQKELEELDVERMKQYEEEQKKREQWKKKQEEGK